MFDPSTAQTLDYSMTGKLQGTHTTVPAVPSRGRGETRPLRVSAYLPSTPGAVLAHERAWVIAVPHGR
jgi:hypothetical protein